MIRAVGYAENDFEPCKPGRLCRGRERWIEPWELLDEEAPDEPIHRLVVSGAEFSDDSAADARRGLSHTGIDLPQLIAALFPRKPLLAFCEDGHPADIPEDAEDVEMYTGYRAGGRIEEIRVRWFKKVSGIREIRNVLGTDPDNPKVSGFLLADDDLELDESVKELIFSLVGLSTVDSPPAQYQPRALPPLLEHTKAVLLLHRDKQGPALGVYSHEPINRVAPRLQTLTDKAGTLLVPFAIPPMLARWDRALYELRQVWNEAEQGPFPVPAGPEETSWEAQMERQQSRRGRRRKKKGKDDQDTSEETEASEAEETEEAEVEAPRTSRRSRKSEAPASDEQDDASSDDEEIVELTDDLDLDDLLEIDED